MLKGHFGSAGASVEYGSVPELLQTETLDATVYRGRDAELALAAVDGSDVVVVAPTSLATSYALGGYSLTAIPIDSLPATTRVEVADALDAPIESFEFIQIGKWVTDSPNHSLAEFADT
ncbi:hypothetical protein [Halobaculum limi]|uniref:hypothetical protein n=1 Tax=Halobaculum limi TaxID=3031916 RepID=UPI002405F6BA|nr:hypothetical protein [Halobaculum sp. YSMS11]